MRLVLDRDVDMLITGTRHPFLGTYKLRITHDGYFKAYELKMINNAGHSVDLSRAVMERALTHCDNVYNFPILIIKKCWASSVLYFCGKRIFILGDLLINCLILVVRAANQ